MFSGSRVGLGSVGGMALGLVLATQTVGCATDAGDEAIGASELGTAGPPVTPDELIGNYDPTGALLRSPKIKDWGGRPMLTGKYLYGDQLFPVDYVLTPVAGSSSLYVGESSITVYYGPRRCNYGVEVEVSATRDASGEVNLYVRDNVPQSLPPFIPVHVPCPRLENSWRVHQRPYVKRGPNQVFAALMDDVCDDITARIRVVEQGKRMAAGPMGDLPPNIYQASGDWQSLSTPGRDQRLRENFRGVYRFAKEQVTTPERAQQFLGIWNQHVRSCRFEYKNSNNRAVAFTLDDVQSRLFDLSFDPYHCTEMRWGAYPSDMAEWATCNTQSQAHVQRWNDEKTMRNIIDRPAAGTPTPIGTGPAEPEDVDIKALLEELAQ